MLELLSDFKQEERGRVVVEGWGGVVKGRSEVRKSGERKGRRKRG